MIISCTCSDTHFSFYWTRLFSVYDHIYNQCLINIIKKKNKACTYSECVCVHYIMYMVTLYDVDLEVTSVCGRSHLVVESGILSFISIAWFSSHYLSFPFGFILNVVSKWINEENLHVSDTIFNLYYYIFCNYTERSLLL